jgi:hypothetical protein
MAKATEHIRMKAAPTNTLRQNTLAMRLVPYGSTPQIHSIHREMSNTFAEKLYTTPRAGASSYSKISDNICMSVSLRTESMERKAFVASMTPLSRCLFRMNLNAPAGVGNGTDAEHPKGTSAESFCKQRVGG